MKVIAVGNQKGGPGKSTLAMSFSVLADQHGEHVVVIDLDKQASLTGWYNLRKAALDRDEPRVVNGRGRKLQELIIELAGEGYTVCVIDTPGMDYPEATQALELAEFCIVPVRGSMFDVQGTTETVDRLKRMGKGYALVLNQGEPKKMSVRNREALNAMENLNGGDREVCETVIAMRVAHSDAASTGAGVTEFEPSGKAAKEIEASWQEIKKLMGDGAKASSKKKGKAHVSGA